MQIKGQINVKLKRGLTFTAVAGITDRLRHDDSVINMAVRVDAEMTEDVVKYLLLHHTAINGVILLPAYVRGGTKQCCNKFG